MNHNFTTTLSSDVYDFLTDMSKKTGLPKNKIIEQVVIFYKNNQKKENMRNDFRKASKDKEITSISEWGMINYKEQIEEYETR